MSATVAEAVYGIVQLRSVDNIDQEIRSIMDKAASLIKANASNQTCMLTFVISLSLTVSHGQGPCLAIGNDRVSFRHNDYISQMHLSHLQL